MEANTPSPLPSDHNVGPALIAWTSILTGLSIITTALRLIVRRGKRVTGWDDWTILATTIVATIRSALNIKGATIGYGRHKWYLTTSQQEKVNMYGFYGQVLLFITLCLLKWSICILILRIKSTKTLKWIVYPLIAGLFLTNLLCIIVLLAECTPVATFWRPSAGTCWPVKIRINSIWLQASYSVFSDFVCSLLPIYLLHNLNMPLRTKAAVCGLMAMGLVATSCAAVRASTLTTTPTDITYAYAVTAIWSNTEIHIGIVATNMSLVRAFYAYFAKRNCAAATSEDCHVATYGSGSRAPRHSWFLHTDVERGRVGHGRRSSGASEMPLSPLGTIGCSTAAITKTTEVRVTHWKESSDCGSEDGRDRVLGNCRAAWNVTPAVRR